MIKIIKKFFIYSVPLIFIMLLVLWHINENYYPKLFGDEYGYWASAAYFAGLDWNDITSLNDYYGWGYGLILSPILKISFSAKQCYISAIVLNGMMIWGIYCILLRLCKEFFASRGELFCCALALMVCLLPSNLYYSQYTMSEVTLAFIYWLLIYTEWQLIRKYDLKKVGAIIILDVAMLSVHFRTIGVILVSIVFVLFATIKNQKGKSLFCVVTITCVFCVAMLSVIYIKRIYQGAIALDFVQARSNNTIDGQIGKIVFLMTQDGIKSFLANVVGRMFSILVNSYLLSGLAVVSGIVCLYMKNGNKLEMEVSKLTTICFLNSASLIAISSLFMIKARNNRFDILTYSRYHEFTTGALLLLGVYFLITNIDGIVVKRLLLAIIIGTLILSKICTYIMNFDLPTSHLYAHNPRCLYFYSKLLNNSQGTYCMMAIEAVLVIVFLYFCSMYNRKIIMTLALICILLLNIYESDYEFNKGCLRWSIDAIKDTEDMVSFLEDGEYTNSLHFFSDDNVLKVDLLQFVLKDSTIQVIDESMIEDKLGSKDIIITTDKYEGMSRIQDSYEKIYEKKRLYFWSKIINE